VVIIKGEIPVIVTKEGRYDLYKYKSENDLEQMIIEHSKEIFGKNSCYFDIKKKINSKAGFGAVPDGYVIDFDKDRLYILEVELIRHDLKRHILPQIAIFKIALGYDKTREGLVDTFVSESGGNSPAYKKLKDRKYLKNVVENNYGIIILIDDVNPQLYEVVEAISSENLDVKVIPFRTYVKGSSFSPSDHIHQFTSFTKEGLEKEAKKWTFKWATVPVEKHLEKATGDVKNVFVELSEKICCIAPDVKEVHRRNWTTYQTSPLKNFCTVKILKDALEINMKVDKASFTDEKGTTKDVKRTPAWTFDKVFKIKSREDIDYALLLIEQAYRCICKPNDGSA